MVYTVKIYFKLKVKVNFKMTNNKKQWKYNPIAKDLATVKYRQRIKRPRSPYDDEQFDIDDELTEYYEDKEGKEDASE